MVSSLNHYSMAVFQLQTASEWELLWLARSLIRPLGPVPVEEYRRELALCDLYSSEARCGRCDCFLIHLCPRLVAGDCQAGSLCRWNHRLDDPDNVIVLLRLRCADLPEEEVFTRLARRLGGEHEALGSSSGVGSHLTSVSSASEDVRGPSDRGDDTVADEADDEITCISATESDSVELTSTPLKNPVNVVDTACSTKGSSLTSLDLCLWNIHPSVCDDRECTKLHVCRLYVSEMCPYGEKCTSGHEPLTSAHNIGVLKRHMLLGVSEGDLLEGLREGYLSRHPIIPAERQLALQMCRPYQTGRCAHLDCVRLHICMKYAQGTCTNQSNCGLSHDIGTASNADIVSRVGLESVPMELLLDILSSPVYSKDVHRALTSGSDDVALEWLSTFIQTRGQCFQLSGASSSLPAGADHTSIRPTQDPVILVRTPGPVTKEDLTWTAANGLSWADIRREGLSLELCDKHVRHGGCDDKECSKLHLCRLFVANVCPSGKQCGCDHKLCTSEHNKGILEQHGIASGCEEDLMKCLRMGYLSRNPLTEAERKSALRVCPQYQTGNCRETKCPRLHICSDFAMGECRRRCGLSHQINSPSHAVIMRRLGLASMRVRDVLKIFQDAGQCYPAYPASGEQYRSKTGDEGVCDTTRAPRVRSAPDADPKDANPAGFNSDSTAKLADEELLICELHSGGNRCTRRDCYKLHICGYYLADVCRRSDESCPLGHDFKTEHNLSVMRRLEAVTHSLEELQALIDKITLTARITFKNGAHREVKLCIPYSSPGGCDAADVCDGFHICREFLIGTCAQPDCVLFHSLNGDHNSRLRGTIGLAAVNPSEDPSVIWATDRDLIELMRAKLSLNPGVYPVNHSEALGVMSTRHTGHEETSRTAIDCKSMPMLPTVCKHYGTTTGCSDINCTKVHICPHFLASSCRSRRCRPCSLEHRLSSLHNRELLREAGCVVTNENHEQLVGLLYESSPHVQRTEAYERLRLCTHHNTNGCWATDCMAIHICQKYIVGSCMKAEGCTRGHSVKNDESVKKLLALGLAEASADEVLEMLRAIHAGPSASPNAVDLEDVEPASKASARNRGRLVSDNPAVAIEVCSAAETSLAKVQLVADPSATGRSLPASSDQHFSTVGSSGTNFSEHVSTAGCGPTVSKMKQCSSVSPGVQNSLPDVCRQYGTIAGCSDRSCVSVHLCPHFVAGSCRRGKHCQMKHDLSSEHNERVLRQVQMEAPTRGTGDELVEELYATSAHIQRTCVYERLRVCVSYNTEGRGCRKETCKYIHVCSPFVAGTCNDLTCGKDHHIRSARNKVMLDRIGLGTASQDEVLEMLRAIHAWRSVCDGLPTTDEVQSSSSSSEVSLPSSSVSSAPFWVLSVCKLYGTVAGCSDSQCLFLHICPHFVANSCRRANRCQLGHELNSPHNLRLLREAGYESATPLNMHLIIEELLYSSNHIPPANVYRKLRVCDRHITRFRGCNIRPCTHMHICSQFVAGTCEQARCDKGHDIQTSENRWKLDTIGLKDVSSDGVLEMLRAVHDWRSVCTSVEGGL